MMRTSVNDALREIKPRDLKKLMQNLIVDEYSKKMYRPKKLSAFSFCK